MPAANFTAIWEFHVRPGSFSQFEQIYGPDGDWARLFRRSPEYKGTVLLRDADRPGRYLTLDHWTCQQTLQQFKHDHQADYKALDRQCENLTEREIFVGNFHTVTD